VQAKTPHTAYERILARDNRSHDAMLAGSRSERAVEFHLLVQDKIGCEKHEQAPLVALTRVAQFGNVVREPPKPGAGYQYVHGGRHTAIAREKTSRQTAHKTRTTHEQRLSETSATVRSAAHCFRA